LAKAVGIPRWGGLFFVRSFDSLGRSHYVVSFAYSYTGSVSGDASYRQHVFAMADFLAGELESLGVSVTTVDLGKQVLDGEEIQLPPALLGRLGDDPKKKTVLLYAHYDVQPVRVFLLKVYCSLSFICSSAPACTVSLIVKCNIFR
jgi:hypothetical protein